MIYASTIESKTGSIIPLFESKRLCHSKYNPEREAEQFISSISYSDIFIVLGIGGAFHINALQKKYPGANIIAMEYSTADIAFLLANSETVKKTSRMKNIIFTTPEKIESELYDHFIPAVYPVLSIVEWRAWKTELSVTGENTAENILNKINGAIQNISQDFATQAQFGKIWQHNIFKNMRLLQKVEVPSLPLEKTAFVAAAGPSLEKSMVFIKKNRRNLFVISTDTAYSALKKSGVFCDAVVSIDGQTLSSTHFFGEHNKKTLFVFDIAGNHQAARALHKKGNTLLFSQNNHPLAHYMAKKVGKQICFHLDSGNGTVTLSSVDLASKLGFEKIIVSGADFGYTKTKTYARGTYLDTLYASSQTKLSNLETHFLGLYFRSNLIKISDEKSTTALLHSYKESFEAWAKNAGFDISVENENYILKKAGEIKAKTPREMFPEPEFDFPALKGSIALDIKNHPSLKDFRSSDILVAILPFLSYLRVKTSGTPTHNEALVNLALDDFMKYTNLL